MAFLSFTASLYDIMGIHFPRKASFSQLHMRAALEDLGISISIPDILTGVAWRETFLEVLKLHHRSRRHNLEKSVSSRLYAVNSSIKLRHQGALANFAMKRG